MLLHTHLTTKPGVARWANSFAGFKDVVWACDFTVANDRLFRSWYISVLLELKTRRIAHIGVTQFPTDEWTAQQLREATPWGSGPKYSIRDRDSKYIDPQDMKSSGICLLVNGGFPRIESFRGIPVDQKGLSPDENHISNPKEPGGGIK